jgi:hypothetical protein
MIYLNNKEPKKYTIEFFAKYFGYTQPDQISHMETMMNSISFLRVHVDPDQNPEKDPTQEVIKFIS